MDALWMIIGKVALVAGVLLTLIQIARIMRPKKTKLIATIRPCEFEWPAFITQHKRALSSLCSWTTREDIVQGLEYAVSKQVKEKLDEHLKQVNDDDFSLALMRHGGMWTAIVANNSADSCEDVRLKIPGCRSAYITKDGASIPVDKPSEVLALGDIRPKESVSVVAWVSTGVSEWQVASIGLNHKKGAGVVKGIYPTPRWAYDLSRNWVQMIWLCIQFIFMWTVVVMLIGLSMGERKAVRKQAAGSDNTSIAVVSTNGVKQVSPP